MIKGSGSQQPLFLIPKPSPGKLLGHSASLCFPPLVLLHLEISILASLKLLWTPGLSPHAHRSPISYQRVPRCFHFRATSTENSKQTFHPAEEPASSYFQPCPQGVGGRGVWLSQPPSSHIPALWREGIFLCQDPNSREGTKTDSAWVTGPNWNNQL